MHPYNNKGKGGGNKNRGKTGGTTTRQTRQTLREMWSNSNTTMEFADWVYNIQDQYDVLQDSQNQPQPPNQPPTQQYYDATTGLTWVPSTMQPVYHAPPVATAPAVATPTVYHPQPVLTTTATPTAPTTPAVLQPQPLLTAAATPITPAPANTPAPPPNPPPSQVVSSAPAAVKAKPPQAPDPTAAANPPAPSPANPPATAPTVPKALVPTPPPYAPGQAPWRNTGTAQIAALRNELREQAEELQEMTEQSQQEIAAYNNEVSAYNAESQAFSEELQQFHAEQGQCNTVLQELRQFQSAFRLDRIDGRAWNEIKNWNSWKGHMTSEFSKELRARYKAWIPKVSRAEHNTTHYPCWHCGFRTYLSNQCMNWACSENHLLQEEKDKQKAEMDELAKKLLEAQDQLKKQSTSTASSTVDIDKLKEQLAEAKQVNEKQETEFKEVMEKKTHLQTEADEYAKQIVFYGQSLSDSEKEKTRMTEAIASQNKFVTEMVGKESTSKSCNKQHHKSPL